MPKIKAVPYILRRGNVYYAAVEIPKLLRDKFGGKARFSCTLETEVLSEAKDRAVRHVADWKAQIAKARGANDAAYWERQAAKVAERQRPDAEVSEPETMFARLRSAASDTEREAVQREITDNADHIGALNVELGTLPSTDPQARRYVAIATGSLVPVLAHVDEYLATLKGKREQKSIDMKEATLKRFAGKFRYVRDVQRRDVQRWVNAMAEGRATNTVQRMLSELRGYWSYLRSIEVITDDNALPFTGLSIPRPGIDPNAERKHFLPRDVVRLWTAAKARDDKLATLIWLDMWTGCHIEEICALRIEHVAKDFQSFDIVSGKTEAAIRTIPIHSKLQPAMRRLVKVSNDGYVLSGLRANKYGDRSALIGKKFGRFKHALGYGRDEVFHSIRRTVSTQFDNASVPEQHAAAILGHTVPGMSFGLYSGGPSLAVKRDAIEKLAYPGVQ